MYDVVILGAGPSGSNLARLLSRSNYKIGLIEKRPLNKESDDTKIKSCGGLLAPAAQRMLAELDIVIPKQIIESPQMYSVKTIDFDNGVSQAYNRHYLNINREGFDRYMYQMIPSSVEKHISTVVKNIYVDNGVWFVDVFDGVNTLKITSKFLVIADGANSFARRKVFSSLKKPKIYTSIQSIYEIDEEMPYYTGFFDSSVTDYYAWTIQKDHKLIVGAALPIYSNCRERFDEIESKILTHLSLNLSKRIKLEGAFINRTTHLNQLHWSGHKHNAPYALIGEAAGATSPTSAEGISYALKSSLYLYESLSQDFSHATTLYRKRCRTIERNILLKMIKSPGMYHSKLRGLVMKSGITAIKKRMDINRIQISTTHKSFS